LQRRAFFHAVVLSTASTSAALAQQPSSRSRPAKIGMLWQGDGADDIAKIYGDALIGSLNGLGYVDGKTMQWLQRSTADPLVLREFARELLQQAPDVVIASSQMGALELQRVTTTVPIVFATAPNPLGTGLVDSLAHPGRNITGLSLLTADTSGKRLGLLKEAIPRLHRVALVFDPKEPTYNTNVASYADPAKALGLDLRHVEIPSPDAIAPTFAAIAKDGFDGAVVVGIMSLLERARLGAAARSEKVPTISFNAEALPHGFLMSYGIDYTENFRRAAVYVDKILKGAKPADLPVEQPTRLKLAINLKAAKALGLSFPPSLLASADDVID
jgi:putative tryptophan/tyrosine transport system substrate-binding protein